VKKFLLVLFLLLCSASLINAQKTRSGQKASEKPSPADYTVKLHISATHNRDNCTGGGPMPCANWLYADAIVNGKKFELMGTTNLDKHDSVLLIPGDYPARLTRDVQTKNSAELFQEYDVLLPDGATWHCVTTGISE
jgi:hypothetical protein